MLPVGSQRRHHHARRSGPTVPLIPSGSEMAAPLASLRSVTYGAMVATLYGTGLRVSEMCALRIEDIDSKRMQRRVPDSATHGRRRLCSRSCASTIDSAGRKARICSLATAPAGPLRVLRLPRPWRPFPKSSGYANASTRICCAILVVSPRSTPLPVHRSAPTTLRRPGPGVVPQCLGLFCLVTLPAHRLPPCTVVSVALIAQRAACARLGRAPAAR